MLALATAAATMTAGVAVAANHLQASTTDVQDVYWFADASPTGGQSVLTRTESMVLATMEAQHLTPGNAYTIWWVVFNEPGNCSDDACGEDDIFVDGNPANGLNVEGIQAAKIAVAGATGNVARTDGTTEFGGRLKMNDTSGAHQIVFPAGLEGSAALVVPGTEAEVHLVVQSHGQARGGKQLAKQLSMIEYGCTPDCEDVQFTVHKP